MLNLRSLFAAALYLYMVEASPQNRNGRNGNGRGSQQRLTAQEQADQIPQGISTATDGSTILDTTARVNGQNVRFKVSAPADQFTTDTGITGSTQTAGAAGTLGINVLLHGDGGQSFFDFPNQAVQNNLAGVAVLAPDPNLFWGGGSGLERTDGVAHAQIVNDLIKEILPQVLAFDGDSVSFTGVSGGSLLLSGFFMPAFMQNFASPAAGTAGLAGARARSRFALVQSAKRATQTTTGQKTSQVLLNCGALAPQVSMSEDAVAALANTRIHFQSTQAELAELQTSIPEAIVAYEQAVSDAGLATQQIAALQTVDNSPNGGHCEFDEEGFVSGVQLMADSFAAVVQGGDGVLAGTNLNVLNPVPGNEQLSFSGAS
ncbi:hypothetical protein F5B22DRAFT_468915 [Xylaria bambusicola]|uniref:uncharacterized protein n=1 Tax=Xylaria bambusicola TaxID=326684 RepID=UPI0020079394|nr:uncharacterized protein F5B22DRAFT_468915 [Xylaria bambusicola]KAI0522280.1 hypothetical protein F5B22DRAFT_468915 [Xylaria bambusicola]